jgi:hypothetical protein
MRLPDFGCQAMLSERTSDPRTAIIGISLIGEVLQLAPAALRKVAAWRRLVPGAMLQRPVFQQQVARNRE